MLVVYLFYLLSFINSVESFSNLVSFHPVINAISNSIELVEDDDSVQKDIMVIKNLTTGEKFVFKPGDKVPISKVIKVNDKIFIGKEQHIPYGDVQLKEEDNILKLMVATVDGEAILFLSLIHI